jgi:hypothetical protein
MYARLGNIIGTYSGGRRARTRYRVESTRGCGKIVRRCGLGIPHKTQA